VGQAAPIAHGHGIAVAPHGDVVLDVGLVAELHPDGNANHKAASGNVQIDISKANATIDVNGYTGVYDGSAHGATGTAKGVKGEDLSNLLHLGNSFTNVPGGTANWSFAGNTASSKISTATFNVDLTKPHDVVFQGGPEAGKSYDFGSVPAAPTCTATDDLSGLKSCVVTDSNTGGTGAVGSHTLTATATDKAGHTATNTLTYTVKAANASGFYSPIDMNNTVNTIKGGSTVPAKFELFGGASNTEQKTLGAVTSMSAKQISCSTLTGAMDAIEEIVSTNATGLRFDTTGDQFIYNWKTPKSPGTCYSLTMTAADNTTKLVAYFKLT